MKVKNYFFVIGLGILNVFHATLHIIQFVQSIVLVTESTKYHEDKTLIDKILHSPYLTALWLLIGLATLIVGIKDFLHHRKCH